MTTTVEMDWVMLKPVAEYCSVKRKDVSPRGICNENTKKQDGAHRVVLLRGVVDKSCWPTVGNTTKVSKLRVDDRLDKTRVT